jgi:hypothetical protein
MRLLRRQHFRHPGHEDAGMTNILYWNVRQFSINLINSPDNNVIPGLGGVTYTGASHQRLGLIVSVIAAAAADIVTIVETQTGSRVPGDLATDSGGLQASRLLLQVLRFIFPAQGWRMVPPLWLGTRWGAARPARTETVTVLYRGTTGNVTRYFTGPNFWSGGVGGISVDPVAAPGVPAAYPNPIDTYLQPARAIPAASLYRPNVQEDQSAARIKYLDQVRRAGLRQNTRRRLQDVERYGGFRPPYMTSFFEQDLVAGTARTLTVFSIHSPPKAGPAKTLMRYFSQTPEILAAPGLGEIKILCGDFNLDFLNAAGTYTNIYNPVTGIGYQSQMPTNLVPPAAGGDALRAYRGYFATHLRDQPPPANFAATAFLWSIGGTNATYPGYGYPSTGSTASIDNILVRPAVAYPFTVLNLVTGTPYVASALLTAPNPVVPVPLGAVVMGTGFAAAPAGAPAGPWPLEPTAAIYNHPDALMLCAWPNYNKVYGTSDHLPLVTTL